MGHTTKVAGVTRPRVIAGGTTLSCVVGTKDGNSLPGGCCYRSDANILNGHIHVPLRCHDEVEIENEILNDQLCK